MIALPYRGCTYSGEFRVRIPPLLHRKLVIAAAEAQISLNRLVSTKLAD